MTYTMMYAKIAGCGEKFSALNYFRAERKERTMKLKQKKTPIFTNKGVDMVANFRKMVYGIISTQ